VVSGLAASTSFNVDLAANEYVWNCRARDQNNNYAFAVQNWSLVIADVPQNQSNQSCDLSWNCSSWSGDGCGDRTCTCACPSGTSCSGDSTTHSDCGDGSPVLFKGDSSPVVFKGGSPAVFKGGGSPSLFKGEVPPPSDRCADGGDNEGTPAVVNGCVDERDWLCGGIESFCYGGVDNDCDGLIDCVDSDCVADDVCQDQNASQEGSMYSVSDILNSLFSEDETPSPVDSATTFKSAADVQVFFGFMNWIIIALLVVLFLGLIFVQHIKPHLSGKGVVPTDNLDAVSAYVARHRAKGESDDEIKQRLKEVGWIDEVIDRSLQRQSTAPVVPPTATQAIAPRNDAVPDARVQNNTHPPKTS
jgi:hypothetical protein